MLYEMICGLQDLFDFDEESEDEIASTYFGCDAESDNHSVTEDDEDSQADDDPAPVTYAAILLVTDLDSYFLNVDANAQDSSINRTNPDLPTL